MGVNKKYRKCIKCFYCSDFLVNRKVCSYFFVLTYAPVVISRHYIIPPGVNAPECPCYKEKPVIGGE